MRKAGVKSDIADGDRQTRQFNGEVRHRETQRQHSAHGADNDPVEQQETPRRLDIFFWYREGLCGHDGHLARKPLKPGKSRRLISGRLYADR